MFDTKDGSHVSTCTKADRAATRVSTFVPQMSNADVMMQPPRIPVLLLTGFLGSGKTSFMNGLLSRDGQPRTLVLINEYGAVPVDNDLLLFAPGTTVVETMTGCICCTVRGDLAIALRDAPARFARAGQCWFERVIIETTGLADPAPIIRTLLDDPAVAVRYRLERTAVVVDLVNGPGSLAREPEAWRQVAAADVLVLSKADLVAEAQTRQLQETLAHINPGATQVIASQGVLDASGWWHWQNGVADPHRDPLAWLNAALPMRSARGSLLLAGGDGDHEVRTVSVRIDEPVSGRAFDRWLDSLLLFRGPDLLRLKGIVHVREIGLPMVIHGVQHVFHPPRVLPAWPGEDRSTRLVFIVRNLDAQALAASLRSFCSADPLAVQPDRIEPAAVCQSEGEGV